MRSIAHISDLHFGAINPEVMVALAQDIKTQNPDLILLSGDVTQRATLRQFAQALRFIRSLKKLCLVVPGNHDLEPLTRPFKRLAHPQWLYQRFATRFPPPLWQDDDLAIVGLDSTRHLGWTSGRLCHSHLQSLEKSFLGLSDHHCRITFLHHPPGSMSSHSYPFSSLATHGLDLILTGHGHRAKVGLVDSWHHHSSILVQAPSACSTRLRGDPNGYAMIFIDMPKIAVEMRMWNGETFHQHSPFHFYKQENRWLGLTAQPVLKENTKED